MKEKKAEKTEDGDINSETLTHSEIRAAVLQGTSQRVRPVVMTATSNIVGLLPIMFINGTGGDVMQRIATPMIGGMLTATFLSLFILPLIYSMVAEFNEDQNVARGSSKN